MDAMIDANTDMDTTPESSQLKASRNVFDNLLCLAKPKLKVQCNELEDYLAMDVTEDVNNVLQWWADNSAQYPRLACMRPGYGFFFHSISNSYISTNSFFM